MDVSVLFDLLDRVERRERPLPPITADLRADSNYVRNGETCYRDECEGSLWKEIATSDGHLVCGVCSTIFGKEESNTLSTTDPWDEFRQDRPRYRHSNVRRQVGGLNTERDDEDGIIDSR